MTEYSRVFLGMQGGRKGELTLSTNAVKIQDTLGYYHKNGDAVPRFGLSMPLLSPTSGPASGLSISRDTTVEVPGSRWLQRPDFCQSEMSQSSMACLCKKNKVKPRAAAAEYCLCLHFSFCSTILTTAGVTAAIATVSIVVNTAANAVKNLIQRERL